MALTFSIAAERFSAKFPDKKLLTFDGSESPCKLWCPHHGEVLSKSYTSLVRSKHGCSACAEESGLASRISRLTLGSYDQLSPAAKMTWVLQRLDELEYALVTNNPTEGWDYESEISSLREKVTRPDNKTKLFKLYGE